VTRRVVSFEIIGFVVLALFALAPTSAEPEDWEALGNVAFQAGRYEEAIRCYTTAGERSRNPGRVAHNHAVALFDVGRYRDAERLFRCQLESARDADQRARALYDLGTCLLHAADGRDANRLAEAIDYLNRCTKIVGKDESVRANAQFNLELAKQQWRRIRTDAPPPPERDPNSNDENSKPDQPDRNAGNEPGNQPGTPNNSGAPRAIPQPGRREGPQPTPTPERPPGAGTMSPIPDDDQLKPLPPNEARDLLRQAADRIVRERRALQRAGSGSDPRAFPDW
jgi:tetratricopeptide (TPR) repeat protein